MAVRMDIAQIKTAITAFFRRAIRMARSLASLPYFKTYLALSLVLTALFIVLTFPYGELITSRLKKMEGNAFTSIDIGYLDVGLIGDTTAEGISLVPPWGSELSIQSLVLDGNINPYSLLVSKDYHGSVRLKNLSYTSERIAFDSNINCNYELKFKPEGSSIESGNIKTFFENTTLKLNDVEIPSAEGMKISLPLMRFSSIVLNSSLKNDTLNIQQMKMSGPDLKCSLSGTVTFAKMMANSRLNLSLTIDDDSPAIEKYKDLLGSFTNADGDIVLNFTGSISRPGIGKKGPESEPGPENESRPRRRTRPRPGQEGGAESVDSLIPGMGTDED